MIFIITEQHRKEGLSRAYALAVGYKAGMNCQVGFGFDYKVDGSYREVEVLHNGERVDSGFQIDFQLKATKNLTIKETEVSYDLDASTYNDLVKTTRAIPRLLVVLKLPEEESEWLEISEDNTILKNCAWYISLKGLPPTQNTSKKTIKIPRDQILTPETLTELMETVKVGEFI